MTTGHVFIAASLDGFIAKPDHGLDWLMKQNTEGEDHGYDPFMADMDGIVMGSSTFKTVLGLGPWPYEKPVVVMSRALTVRDVPDSLSKKVRVSNRSPVDLMAELGAAGWRNAYIDGGEVIQSFLRRDLIADMTVTLIPILLGAGRRLFGPIEEDIDLILTETRSFPSGLVQMRYSIPSR